MIPDALAGQQWVRDRARRTRACLLGTAVALATVLAAVTFSVGSYFLANLPS